MTTVLVVDDEEIVRSTAAGILEKTGFRVLTAENGHEALQVMSEQAARIDLTVLDLSMPVMDGEEAFREIRATWPTTRVVLSTGYGESEAAERMKREGVAAILPKPYSAARLTELMRDLGLVGGAEAADVSL